MESHLYYQRFKLILSDPINQKINKLPESGKLENGIITMYNGVKVYKSSYYGVFADILILNEGVHEPSEEFLFQEVLNHINSDNPTMLELGSYWGFYSMSFLKKHPTGKCTLVESGVHELETGKSNFELNNMEGTFINGFIGDGHLSVDDLIDNHLTILHSDIQGYELQMLHGAKNSLLNKKIDYCFISTHNNNLHYNCIELLKKMDYKIIGEVDVANTFCEDGIILAVSPNIDFPEIQLPKKIQHEIISNAHLNQMFKNGNFN